MIACGFDTEQKIVNTIIKYFYLQLFELYLYIYILNIGIIIEIYSRNKQAEMKLVTYQNKIVENNLLKKMKLFINLFICKWPKNGF